MSGLQHNFIQPSATSVMNEIHAYLTELTQDSVRRVINDEYKEIYLFYKSQFENICLPMFHKIIAETMKDPDSIHRSTVNIVKRIVDSHAGHLYRIPPARHLIVGGKSVLEESSIMVSYNQLLKNLKWNTFQRSNVAMAKLWGVSFLKLQYHPSSSGIGLPIQLRKLYIGDVYAVQDDSVPGQFEFCPWVFIRGHRRQRNPVTGLITSVEVWECWSAKYWCYYIPALRVLEPNPVSNSIENPYGRHFIFALYPEAPDESLFPRPSEVVRKMQQALTLLITWLDHVFLYQTYRQPVILGPLEKAIPTGPDKAFHLKSADKSDVRSLNTAGFRMEFFSYIRNKANFFADTEFLGANTFNDRTKALPPGTAVLDNFELYMKRDSLSEPAELIEIEEFEALKLLQDYHRVELERLNMFMLPKSSKVHVGFAREETTNSPLQDAQKVSTLSGLAITDSIIEIMEKYGLTYEVAKVRHEKSKKVIKSLKEDIAPEFEGNPGVQSPGTMRSTEIDTNTDPDAQFGA